jgi:hypothetical protein
MDTGFENFLRDFEAAAPADFRRAFRLALIAGAWAAPILIGRLPPLSRLSPEQQERALTAMEHSRVPELRQLLRVLKTVASLHYGGLAAVRQSIGYHQ